VNCNYEIFLIIANCGQKKPYFQLITLNIGIFLFNIVNYISVLRRNLELKNIYSVLNFSVYM